MFKISSIISSSAIRSQRSPRQMLSGPHGLDTEQRYGLVVTLWHVAQEVRIYQELRARIRQPVRVSGGPEIPALTVTEYFERGARDASEPRLTSMIPAGGALHVEELDEADPLLRKQELWSSIITELGAASAVDDNAYAQQPLAHHGIRITQLDVSFDCVESRQHQQTTKRAIMWAARTGQGERRPCPNTLFSARIATRSLPRFFISLISERTLCCVHTVAASG